MSIYSASVRKRVLQLAPTVARRAPRAVSQQEINALADRLAVDCAHCSQRDVMAQIEAAFGIRAATAPPTPEQVVARFAAPQPAPSTPLTGSAPMSLQLQAARVTNPPISTGIFGTIGGILKGAAGGLLAGGPVGGILGGIAGGVGANLPQQGPMPTPPIAPPPTVPSGIFQQGMPQQPPMTQPGQTTRTFGGLQFGPLELGRETQTFVPSNGAGAPGVGCPSGYRPNKTSYFLKSGQYVPAGTRCVKVRRRNPLNPRALSRAISRVEQAKRAAKRTNRITIRKSC